MDSTGVVLATSNADTTSSFLGQDYGFRPYFKRALAGQRSDYFAIGATSGRPGYFVAEPVTFAQGQQNGVIAIKLDISELQRSWESDSETVVAINKNGIIVLASNPEWLYRPVYDLAPALRKEILESRQFGNQTLSPLDWDTKSETRVRVEGSNYIAATGQAEWRDWSVIYLKPEALVTQQTLLTTGLFGSIIALLVGFATFLRSRRIELAYAASERQRATLIETNNQLEQAQSELARTAKLSALGHLAASVTHELGQPISAFRNHLAAAEIGGEITSPSTAKNLNKLVERMEAITKQFRYFARGRGETKTTVDLRNRIEEVRQLLETEIAASNASVAYSPPRDAICIKANKVLLEQALVNLLKNALHAVKDETSPLIGSKIDVDTKHAKIHISDNGPGLSGAKLSDLQEPFFSSKPSGVGMGLGLAITTEIIHDHGGDLELGTTATGAEFIARLPLSSNEGTP